MQRNPHGPGWPFNTMPPPTAKPPRGEQPKPKRKRAELAGEHAAPNLPLRTTVAQVVLLSQVFAGVALVAGWHSKAIAVFGIAFGAASILLWVMWPAQTRRMHAVGRGRWRALRRAVAIDPADCADQAPRDPGEALIWTSGFIAARGRVNDIVADEERRAETELND